MISEFVERFMENKSQLESMLVKHPESYKDLVQMVVEVITSDDYYDIDPKRVHQIDDGDYQGTLIFVIGCKGYQPNDYWYLKVFYGSCSGCDSLQSICGYSGRHPNKVQIEQYMQLALNIVQGLKKME